MESVKSEAQFKMNRYKHLSRYFKFQGRVFTGATFRQYFDYPVKLPNNVPLIVAIDGSTAQTGVAIFTDKMRLVGLFDFINDGAPNTNLFMAMMEAKFAELLDGCNIVKLIVEKPFAQSKSKDTYGKLSEVLGMVKTLPFTVPALNGVKVQTILAVSWRKYVFVKPEYKGRKQKKKDVKVLAVLETEERFPFTKDYSTLKKPMDSCDACCIGIGYMLANYDTEGTRIANKTMDISYNHLFEYEVNKYSDVNVMMKEWGSRFKEHGYEIMKYNNDMTIIENVRRVTGITNKYVLLEVPRDISSIVLMWQKGYQLLFNQSFVVICKRTNYSEKLD